MLREIDHGLLDVDEEASVWPVLGRDNVAAKVSDRPARTPLRPTPAAPDVPAAAGVMLFLAYAALIAALAIATAGPGQSGFMLVIAGLFVVAFFAVPKFILAQEPKDGKRPSLDRFLATGLSTYTGQCSGGAALAQMLIVPICLTFGILGMAIISAFVF